ncbi:MAG TPA: helix-turn-helix domain-containing protein [Pseudonocardiaceae bacterium]|nr:helix-turn-helix domain-containing protein [Pseudonocardiaceae bacterium]
MTSVDRAASVTPCEAPTPADALACDAALGRAFEFLGKRWNGAILVSLGRGPAGFAELRRGVGGITDSVLSDRLTELTLVGLIARTVSDTRPPTVTYQLTNAGTTLMPVFEQLATWAGKNLNERQCREGLPR